MLELRGEWSLGSVCWSAEKYLVNSGDGFRYLTIRPSMTCQGKGASTAGHIHPNLPLKAVACRQCLPSATRMQWGRKIKMQVSWGNKGRRKFKDSILEAYVLESLQPVPCQENISRVGYSNLLEPQMVCASALKPLCPQRVSNRGHGALWCGYPAT